MRLNECLLFLISITAVDAELVSLSMGTGAVAALGGIFGGYNYIKCRMFECCEEPWIHKDITSALRKEMDDNLYGQHLAKTVVLRTIQSHLKNKSPKKALVLSFHGWPGTGKNYLATMISKAMFQKGPFSSYYHLFPSTLHFTEPDEVPKYQAQIRSWIMGNITVCERSLFVFDEIDKLPAGTLDAVRPFIDFYERLGTVDPRKSVFIFISNAGGQDISRRTLEHYTAALPREELKLHEMETLIKQSAYNEGLGGLKQSTIIDKHLIDGFVPFLPLERKHVRKCIEYYMRESRYRVTDKRVDIILDETIFAPRDNPIFSSNGCKQVPGQVDKHYGEERDVLNEL